MAMGPYDSALQMFVQTPPPIDMCRLTFMRWLAEQGRLEHRVEGPSSGPLVGRSPENGGGGEGGSASVAAARPKNAMGTPAQEADKGKWFPDGQTGGFMESGQHFSPFPGKER